MAGILLNVIPKTLFDFGGVGTGASSPYIPLGEPIDALDYATVGLIVRVHSVAIVGASDAIQVALFDDGFLDTSGIAYPSLVPIGPVVVLGSSKPAPYAEFRSYPIVGRYISVAIEGFNITGSGVAATISVDVCLRNPDDT